MFGMGMGIGCMGGIGGTPSLSAQISAMFAANQQGAWYDPSDFSTLFQDSAGATPVTAVEQPVGLMLDKRLGLVRGPELVSNGTFDTNVAGWSAGTGTSSIALVAGELVLSGTANNDNASTTIACEVGKTYELTATARAGTSNAAQLRILGGPSATFTLSTANVRLSYIFLATAASHSVNVVIGTAGTAIFDNVSCKLLAGNHATQATAASRPVVSARVNLLVKTEDFADVAWVKSAGASITPNHGTAPDGTMTAARVILPATGEVRQLKASPGVNTINSWVKGVTGETLAFLICAVGAPPLFTFTGAWQQIVRTDAVNPAEFIVYGTYSGATAKDFQIWHPQLETGTTATRYQRVNTASDYDTAGFPMFLRFDGVDDGMLTAAIDFSASDKLAVFAGLNKKGLTTGIVVELSATTNVNNGAFGIYAQDGANNYVFASRGTLTVNTAAPAIYAPPITNVLAGIGNISAPLGSLKVNAGVATTSAASQGTGNYGNYPVYLGSRAGTGLFFNGNIYSLIIRGAVSSAAEIAVTERYVANKTGVTL